MQKLIALGAALLGVACQQSPTTSEPAPSTSASAAKPAPTWVIAGTVTTPAPSASAPAPAATSSGPPVAVTSPEKKQRCHDAAKICEKALLTTDYDKIIDCMPQRALTSAGGRQATISDMMKSRAQMSRDGISFAGAEVEAPRDMVSSGGQIFAILPQHVTMRVPKGKLVQDGFLLGISDDDGASWKFVDGAALNTQNVTHIFPNFPSTLTLPVVTDPQAYGYRK